MINQLLSRIHVMLENIDKQKQKINKVPSSTTYLWITNYSPRFRQVCFDALHSLLINTDKIILIEGDCHKLYIRIIKVLKELDSTFHNLPFNSDGQTSAEVIDKGESLILSVDHQSRRFTTESVTDIQTIQNLITAIFKSKIY